MTAYNDRKLARQTSCFMHKDSGLPTVISALQIKMSAGVLLITSHLEFLMQCSISPVSGGLQKTRGLRGAIKQESLPNLNLVHVYRTCTDDEATLLYKGHLLVCNVSAHLAPCRTY